MKQGYSFCFKTILVSLMLVLLTGSLVAQSTVTIGAGAQSGTSSNGAAGDPGPMYRSGNTSNFVYSRHHYLYTQAELAAAGITAGNNILKLAWNKDLAAATNSTFTFQIWIKNSSKTTVGAGGQLWTDLINGATQVYNSSTITLASPAQWHEFDFSAPFLYTGDALEITVNFDISNGVSPYTTAGFSWKKDPINDRTLSYVGSTAPGATLPNLRTVRPQIQITTAPASPCTAPPTAGIAVASTSTPICTGMNVNLNLNGNSIGSGQTYVWQSSVDAAPPHSWTNISSAASTTGFSVSPGVTTFYRAAVTCSGVTSYSDSVKVVVNPPFPGGTYTINQGQPTSATNFQTFAEAIIAINCGISGNVVFNVLTDQTFTEDLPEINSIGSSTATIVFQKSGTGANPKIIPLSQGVVPSSTTVSSHGDGIIVLNGTDYITFDGIDLDASSGFTGTGSYEYGYYLKKASGTDACKNVVIKNSSISLSKTIHSFGVFISNISGTTSVSVTTTGGRAENIKVFNNIINSCYGGVNATGFASATPYDLYDQNIQIGVEGANTIDQYGGAGTAAYGIYGIYQNNLKVANNVIASSPGTTTTLYGIFLSTGLNSNVDIYNNTVTITGGGTTSIIYGINNGMGGTGTSNTVKIYNNTITNCAYPTATSGSMYLLYQSATAYNAHIYGNTITNNTHSPTTTGSLYCIYQAGALVNEGKVYNNTINNNNKTTGTTSGSSYYIYYTSAATANGDIYGNVISTNSSTNTTSGILYGINSAAGATVNIYKNRIFDITSNSTGGSVYGIALTGGTTNNVYNNFISDLKAPTVSSADAIRAISVAYSTASTSINVSYNTVYLNAMSSGANFGTSAVYHTANATATTASLTLRNNNLVNISVPNGTGFSAVHRRSSTALGNYNAASDKNNLFAGTGNPSNVLFYDGTNTDADLNSYKTRVTPRDASSVSEDPPFVDVTAPPYNLDINAAVPTQLESGGTPVPGITEDFYGTTRNVLNPDIGAHEFAGIPADFTGPSISYTILGNTICTTPRTISATITDASGVNTTAGTKPRLWYKKSTENDMLPATNTSADNGWKWVEASNATSPFTFTIDYSLLTSPVVGGDSISYFIVAQDNFSTPNVGVNIATFNSAPASVALSGAAFPVSAPVNGYNILSLPNPIPVVSNVSELCLSGTVILNVDGTPVTGGEFQWQSSPAGANTWTDIAGATTVPYTTGNITASTDFRLVVKCGGTPVASSPSAVVTVTVNNPQVLTTTNGSRCGVGTVNLSATTEPGMTLNWYTASSGGTPVATGTTYTTPVISSNTTYYVSASSGGGGTQTVGANDLSIGTFGSWTSTAQWVNFTVISATTIQSVDMFWSAALGSNFTIVIRDASTSTTVFTYNGTTTATGTTNAQVVPINATLPPGNYQINLSGTNPGTYRNNAGGVYPYTIPGVISITGNTFDPVYYYMFYRWQIVTGCESARSPVTATVTAPPVLTVTPDKTICNNAIHKLEVTSNIADFNSYVWSPQTELYTDAAATIPYAGGNATEVYLKTLTPGAATYIVTATNTTTQCANEDTSFVTVLPDPVISASQAEICVSGTSVLSLTPNTGYGAASFQWQVSSNGTTYSDIATATASTYTTPTLTQTTYYKLIMKDQAGASCSQSPTFMVTVNNPQITGTSPASRCGTGTVNLGATANPGATINWYGSASGGSSLATGPTFTTPVIGSTTTYYVSSSEGGGGTSSLGRIDRTNTTANTNTNSGLVFSAPTGGLLQSVSVYPSGSGAGTLTIVLKTGNAPGATVLASTTVNLTGGPIASAPKTVVPLNFTIPPGSNYYLSAEAWSGGVTGLGRELTGSVFPYTSPTTDWQITASWLTTGTPSTTTHYYYFYDWVVVQGCESARTAVVATVTPTASNAAGTAGVTECATANVAGVTEVNYTDCDLVTIISPSGGSPITGNLTACVHLYNSVQLHNSKPYVPRVYNITPAAAGTGSVTLYYLQSEFDAYNAANGGLPDLPVNGADAAGIANIRVDINNNTSLVPSAPAAAMVTPSSVMWNATLNRWEITLSNGLNAENSFFVHTGNYSLPVTGLELKGTPSGDVNRLSWSTLTETNNRGFELQRSADGINFSMISFVSSKAENGNSNSLLDYGYNDGKPFSGNNYYRLKQVDKDGKYSYSNIVMISRKVSDITLSGLYPNPAVRELNLVITSPRSEKLSIIVTDLTGKVVMQRSIQVMNGENLERLNVQSLAAGTYNIKFICADGCETIVHRFVKH